MALLIEILIGIVLFTAIVVPITAKDPLGSIGDYPPAIRQKCFELGLVPSVKKRFTKREYIKKIVAMIIMAALLALVIAKINGASGFLQGFGEAYIIWLAVDWWDALAIDCGWFCHSKKVIIPGTEGMKEYKDYLFHIKQSAIGMVLGLPVCLIAGGFTALFGG